MSTTTTTTETTTHTPSTLWKTFQAAIDVAMVTPTEERAAARAAAIAAGAEWAALAGKDNRCTAFHQAPNAQRLWVETHVRWALGE